jgi:hypothetical protein
MPSWLLLCNATCRFFLHLVRLRISSPLRPDHYYPPLLNCSFDLCPPLTLQIVGAHRAFDNGTWGAVYTLDNVFFDLALDLLEGTVSIYVCTNEAQA